VKYSSLSKTLGYFMAKKVNQSDPWNIGYLVASMGFKRVPSVIPIGATESEYRERWLAGYDAFHERGGKAH